MFKVCGWVREREREREGEEKMPGKRVVTRVSQWSVVFIFSLK